MLHLVAFAITVAAVVIGYTQSRRFVRSRLRFVDAVQTMKAPFIAGVGAMLVAAPVVALLPLVGAGTAVSFGVAVGAGVVAGARDIRQNLLPPG